jgi:adenylate kinase family enzyme
LQQGKAVGDDLVNEAVSLITSRAVCQSRGWILDGYPQTFAQAESMERAGLIPHLIVQLNIQEKDMLERMSQDFKTDSS